MKYVFRLGYILIPCLFFLSQTANSADHAVDPGIARAPVHHKKKTREPASLPSGNIQLTRLSAFDGESQPAPDQPPERLISADDVRSVTPPFGSGVGVEASVIRFR